MKYQPSALSLILAVLIFISCNHKDSTIPKQDSLAKNNNRSLAGQLYLFAPGYDSTNFVAFSDGDCSEANALFLDDSVFLYIDYCDEGCSYLKGIYHLDNDELKMNFDSLAVEKLYPDYDGRDSIGNGSPVFTYNTVVSRPDKLSYKKNDYKGRIVFTAPFQYGALDTGNVADLMTGIKAEGIWDRLTGKTKLVNPNSPAAAMPDMLGVWAAPGDRNSSFEIQENSIFYTDGSREYKYTVEQDSLKIKYDGYLATYAVKMNGTDTLILDDNKRHVFYRFRN